MAQTKTEKTNPVMAFVEVPRNIYDGLTVEAGDEEGRARGFSYFTAEVVAELFLGGKLIAADLARRIADIIEKPDFQPLEMLPVLQRGMSKTPEGRTVLSIEVDQAFVETLRIWARAGGHNADWKEYVTRAFAHVMHMGWLAGVPTDAVQLQLSPADYEDLRQLCSVPAGAGLTGTDVVELVRALQTPEPSFVEKETETGVPA